MQCLKRDLQAKAPKTVNNILAVLSVLLKKAVEWEVIERMPCSIKLLPVPKGSTACHDFDDYERLVEAARILDPIARTAEQPNGPTQRGGSLQDLGDVVETGTDLGRKVNG